MRGLDSIAETIRRQRKDLDGLIEESTSRSNKTSQLVSKLEELRQRTERSDRIFDETTPAVALKTKSRR